MAGRKVSLEFEGAMQVADVWVDGQHRLTHEGGYLPFVLDLSDGCSRGSRHRPAASGQPGQPPGSAGQAAGGNGLLLFFRPVSQRLDACHGSAACQQYHPADKPAGGGIFVRYENVSAASADVLVSVDVVNEGAADCRGEGCCQPAGRRQARTSQADFGETRWPPARPPHSTSRSLSPAPRLWSPEAPNSVHADGDGAFWRRGHRHPNPARRHPNAANRSQRRLLSQRQAHRHPSEPTGIRRTRISEMRCPIRHSDGRRENSRKAAMTSSACRTIRRPRLFWTPATNSA